MRQEKRKKKGGEKAKSKSQDCCVTFKPKNYLEIFTEGFLCYEIGGFIFGGAYTWRGLYMEGLIFRILQYI